MRAVMERRIWSYVAGVVFFSVTGISIGCVATKDAADPTGQVGQAGMKPTQNCEQYLAILSESAKQSALPSYGTGGSCWSGTKEQSRQCDASCKRSVSEIIRRNLNQSPSATES